MTIGSIDTGSVVMVSEVGAARLCVYFDEFNSHRYMHIRYWYKDRRDGEWKPGSRGVAIPVTRVNQTLQAIKQVLAIEHGKANQEETLQAGEGSGHGDGATDSGECASAVG